MQAIVHSILREKSSVSRFLFFSLLMAVVYFFALSVSFLTVLNSHEFLGKGEYAV